MSNFLKSVWRLWNSPHWGLNPGPSVYKTDALPLSYRGSDAKRYIGRLQTHSISTSFSSLPMHARILGGAGEQRKAKEEQGTREEQWEKKKGNFRERERETEIQQHFQILGKSKAMKEQSQIDCISCHELTAVGFEPTQLALVELESTPLDHSGKLSCNTWWQWLGYRVRGVIICLTFCMNVWCLTTMSFAQVKEKQKWDNRTQDREMDKRQTQ